MTDIMLDSNTVEQCKKQLEWLTFNFPHVENPKDDTDRLCNCIHLYCENAVAVFDELEKVISDLQGRISELSKNYTQKELNDKVAVSRKNAVLDAASEMIHKAVSGRIGPKDASSIADLYFSHVVRVSDICKIVGMDYKDLIVHRSANMPSKGADNCETENSGIDEGTAESN